MTELRRLFPLSLVDLDGDVQQWNLLARWQARLIELPPLTSGNGAAECIKTYLSRKPAWRSLRETMKANAQRAVIYSFRHSYSLRGHQRGIDAGSMAQGDGAQLRGALPLLPVGEHGGHHRGIPSSLRLVDGDGGATSWALMSLRAWAPTRNKRQQGWQPCPRQWRPLAPLSQR